jgi:hypothetical protein
MNREEADRHASLTFTCKPHVHLNAGTPFIEPGFAKGTPQEGLARLTE